MDRPVIFLVADDGRVLDALAGDLGRRFGADYRIVAERSPRAALAALEPMVAAAADVALLVAARPMAEMGGLELLQRAHELHPGAKRVLLEHRGEWTSAEPIVRAMTLGQLDYVLFHPWKPIEEHLYLPVSEFLGGWEKSRAPGVEAIRVVGPTWAASSHRLRDTLARAGIPYGFYPDDSVAGRRLLEEAGEDGTRLPVVVFRREPSVPGGQAGTTSLIRNYLGFPHGLSGQDLTWRMFEQAWLFGAELILAQAATGLAARGLDRVVRLADGGEVVARAVILATGVALRRLGVPALEALAGAGVFYGAAGSEARAMRGEDVVVVGAGNSAGQAALHLARFAASVTIVAIEHNLHEHMSDYLVQQVLATPNIHLRLHHEVVDGHGRRRLEGTTVRDRDGGATQELAASAVFVLIGAEPHTDWLAGVVERDRGGYLVTGRDLLEGSGEPQGGAPADRAGAWPLERAPMPLETSLPGVFAAGDVRDRSVKRVASAVGEGAIAVQLVHEYLEGVR
jgi:thioredoxin reductase (NADPH)